MQLFAVLIGIGSWIPEYNLVRLRGAVPDVLAFNGYLEYCLGVPSDQITILADEKATHFAIIEALTNLRMDDRIRVGDAILIYYSGHSIQMDLDDQSKTAAIVTCDCADKFNKDVEPIPYFVLEILLARIASQKGNNIVGHPFNE